MKNMRPKNQRLKKLLDKIMSTSAITADTQLEEDLIKTIGANSDKIDQLPRNDFRRIFWEQQVCMNDIYNTMPFLYLVCCFLREKLP